MYVENVRGTVRICVDVRGHDNIGEMCDDVDFVYEIDGKLHLYN